MACDHEQWLQACQAVDRHTKSEFARGKARYSLTEPLCSTKAGYSSTESMCFTKAGYSSTEPLCSTSSESGHVKDEMGSSLGTPVRVKHSVDICSPSNIVMEMVEVEPSGPDTPIIKPSIEDINEETIDPTLLELAHQPEPLLAAQFNTVPMDSVSMVYIDSWAPCYASVRILTQRF